MYYIEKIKKKGILTLKIRKLAHSNNLGLYKTICTDLFSAK